MTTPQIITPEQTRVIPGLVFTALNNAAEGGWDHADDEMTDAEVARSLLDYYAELNDIWASLEEDHQDDPVDVLSVLEPVVSAQVTLWRTQRRAGVAVPSPETVVVGDPS